MLIVLLCLCYKFNRIRNLRSGVLFSFSDGGREKGRNKERLVQLLQESSAVSPDSGLLSH